MAESVRQRETDKLAGSGEDRGLDVASLLRAINTAAANLDACAEGAEKASDSISKSCETPGTKGASQQRLLRTKVQSLKSLAALCNITVTRLMEASAGLLKGEPQQKVLGELLAATGGIGMQLRREQDNDREVLEAMKQC